MAGPGTTESEQDAAFKWLEKESEWVAEAPQTEILGWDKENTLEAETSQDLLSWIDVSSQPPVSEAAAWQAPAEDPGKTLPVEIRPVSAEIEPEVSAWLETLDDDNSLPEKTEIPSWVSETAEVVIVPDEEDLPDWLKDEAADDLPPQPAAVSGWVPDEKAVVSFGLDSDSAFASVAKSLAATQSKGESVPKAVPVVEQAVVPAASPAPRPVVRQTDLLGGDKDSVALRKARELLGKSSLETSMTEYMRLIKKGKLMEDIIFDLQEATYRHPVDVIVWQTLGDAYMRSNRLQEALDSYTKAEELLR